MGRRILITAGSTREPIDSVRFIGNRSSGRLGLALASAAAERGHEVTLVLGVVGAVGVGAAVAEPPEGVRTVRVETTQQLADAVASLWARHELLIMAAAVADFRPRRTVEGKLRRGEGLTLELEPTPDVLAAAAGSRGDRQRVVGFSLDEDTPEARERAAEKLAKKGLDLIVFNPLRTMDAVDISAELMWATGEREPLEPQDKRAFAGELIDRAVALLPAP